MSDLRYIENYKHNEKYRLSLEALVNKEFDITLEKWYQLGCWDQRYVPHAMVNDDQVVANLSTTTMTMCVDGEALTAVEIGTVLTREGYRGQGLNSHLMRAVIEAYESEDLMFLFADEEAVPYYEKYGFVAHVQKEYSLVGPFEASPRFNEMTQLNIEDQGIREVIRETSVNAFKHKKFGIYDGEGILLWYLVNFYGSCIYYIEELETIVVGEMNEECYELYKVIAPEQYELTALLQYILPSLAKKIKFHFTPDDDLRYTVLRMEEPIFIRSKKTFDEFEQFTTTAKS